MNYDHLLNSIVSILKFKRILKFLKISSIENHSLTLRLDLLDFSFFDLDDRFECDSWKKSQRKKTWKFYSFETKRKKTTVRCCCDCCIHGICTTGFVGLKFGCPRFEW